MALFGQKGTTKDHFKQNNVIFSPKKLTKKYRETGAFLPIFADFGRTSIIHHFLGENVNFLKKLMVFAQNENQARASLKREYLKSLYNSRLFELGT